MGKILYKSYLKKLKKCPFCDLKKEETLRENKDAILIFAQAPYTKDHLLVIPKKHVLKLNLLSKKQKENIEKIIYYGLKKLHRKYDNVSILYREGKKKDVGKSIDHIHYHLIPNLKIGACNINGNKRKIYSDKEYTKKVKEIKKRLNI